MIKKSIFKKSLLLFLCLLVTGNCYAQVSWHKFSYFKNWGGLNDQLSSTEIDDGEATALQNVVFDTGGAIKKRFGYKTLPNIPAPSTVATGSTVAITGLAYYRKSNGDKFAVAVTNNDSKATAMVKPYSGGLSFSETWANIDFNEMPSGYTNNSKCDFAVAEDTLIFTVGTQNKPYKWAGTGKVSGYGGDIAPEATIVEYHKNHMFLAGDDDNPSRVTFSNLDDVFTFTVTDFFDVETSDGSRVRSLKSAFDSLYIFKDSSIWRLSGYERDSFRLELMVSGIGTLANESVTVVNNYIYFTTKQNDIAVYDGGYDVKFISQKIRNTIGELNFSRAQYNMGLPFSTYKYIDYDYYCAVSSGATNDTILLFDTAFSAWTKFSGIKPNAWCVAENAQGQDVILFGDTSGYTHIYPSSDYYDGNISTSAINAFYQTKWFKYSDISLGDKYWRVLKTYAAAENTQTFLSIEAKADQEASGNVLVIDLSPTTSLWDVAVWDVDSWAGAQIVINRQEVERGTQMFQLRYSNADVNKGFTILGFENFIEPTERGP